MYIINLIFDPNTAQLIEESVNDTVCWIGRTVTWMKEALSFAMQKVAECFEDVLFTIDFIFFQGIATPWPEKIDYPVAGQFGKTLLAKACVDHSLHKVQWLLKHGASVDKADYVGETPLFHACKEKQFDIARVLIANGADINKKFRNGWTLLHNACFENLDKASALLELGAQIDIENASGETPLFIACQRGDLALARALIAKGADINKKNSQGVPRLFRACQERDFCMAAILLMLGANVDIACEEDGKTPLMCASEKGFLEIMLLLFQKSVDVNKQNHIGETALIWASHEGHVEVVKKLLAKGADVDMQEDSGDSALMLAAARGHTEVAKVLLEKKADVNKQNNVGNTALISACMENAKIELVELLLAKGADVNKHNQYGETALHAAILYKNSHLTARLLKLTNVGHLLRLLTTKTTALHMLFEDLSIININELRDVFLKLSSSHDVTCKNEEDMTPLASLLDAEGDDLNSAQHLIQNLFPEFGAVKNVLKTKGAKGFLNHFREYPDELISDPDNHERANPFRLALLFDDKKLGFLLASSMTLEMFLVYASELEKAYPKIPVAEFLYNSILTNKTPITGLYEVLKKNFRGKIDFAKKDEKFETFFQSLLSLPRQDRHYVKTVIKEFFKDFGSIQHRISRPSTEGFLEHFIQNPEKLIEDAENEPNANPLEVAFLFGSLPLARAIHSKLTQEEFHAFGGRLTKSFPKSDTQVFLFFVEYDLTHAHLTKILSGKIPPKPENSTPDDFLKLFDSIDLSDPQVLKAFCANRTKESLRKVVLEFVNKIKERKGIQGDHAENTPARQEFYTTLENGVCGISHFLLTQPKSERLEKKKIKVMSEMIKDITYCGPKIRSTISRQYNSVVRNYALTFDNLLFSKLTDYRCLVVDGIIPQNEQNTHDLILAVKRCGKDLGLAESQELAEFDDLYNQSGEGIDPQKIKKAFFEIYTPLAIVNMIANEIISDDEFREQYATWWQDHAPASFEGSLSEILKKVKKLGKKKEDVVAYLKSKDIEIQENQNPNDVLDEMRRQNFVLEEVYEDVAQNRFKRSYIIKSLEKLNVIKALF